MRRSRQTFASEHSGSSTAEPYRASSSPPHFGQLYSTSVIAYRARHSALKQTRWAFMRGNFNSIRDVSAVGPFTTPGCLAVQYGHARIQHCLRGSHRHRHREFHRFRRSPYQLYDRLRLTHLNLHRYLN